jgi:hypothetical protein
MCTSTSATLLHRSIINSKPDAAASCVSHVCTSGHTLTPSNHGLLTTLAHQLGPGATPSYALEGSVAVAGLGISWLRDNLRIIDSADDSEPIAASVSGLAWALQFANCLVCLLCPAAIPAMPANYVRATTTAAALPCVNVTRL